MTFDPLLAFFALGFLARVVGSDLRLPGPLYESLTVLLLLSIGLKGGVELAEQELTTLWLPVLAVAAMGVLLTFIAYAALRGLVRVARVDAAAIAAHYGSVSVGTFAVASAVLAERSYPLEPYLPLLVVVLEVPAIVVGIALARGMGGGAPIRPVLGEIVTSKSIVLLVGGLAVGWFAGRDGLEPVAPVFMSGFKGALALFLLEMGVVCGERVGSLRHAGIRLAFFAVIMPCVGGVIGAAVGNSARTRDDYYYNNNRGYAYSGGGYSNGYYQQAPAYVESQPAYVESRPVYVESRPVYVEPPRYYYDNRPDVVVVERRGYVEHDRGWHHGGWRR